MKVFSVAYFSRGGSKRNSKGSSSSSSGFGSAAAAVTVNATTAPGNVHGGGSRSRDDRPFPPPSSSSSAIPSGAYIITSPPRYYDVNSSGGGGLTAQTSHTLQFVRGSVQHRGGRGSGGAVWRGSNPDLGRMNTSGFTIYDEYEEASSSSLSRGRRRGSSGGAGEKGLRSMKNPFQRSRSTSGGRTTSSHHELRHGPCQRGEDDRERGFVWPTHFYPAMATKSPATATPTSSEPIYSEPLPPMTMRVREAEKKLVLKQSTTAAASPSTFSRDPAEISTHIYEYLVTRRSDASTQMVAHGVHKSAKVAPATLPKPAPQPVDARSDSRSVPGPATRRRGSLSSSSPSSSAASSSSKRDSQYSNSGKKNGRTKGRKGNSRPSRVSLKNVRTAQRRTNDKAVPNVFFPDRFVILLLYDSVSL